MSAEMIIVGSCGAGMLKEIRGLRGRRRIGMHFGKRGHGDAPVRHSCLGGVCHRKCAVNEFGLQEIPAVLADLPCMAPCFLFDYKIFETTNLVIGLRIESHTSIRISADCLPE